MGIIRHVDAGYPRAVEMASEHGVRIPMREGIVSAATSASEERQRTGASVTFASMWKDLASIGHVPRDGWLPARRLDSCGAGGDWRGSWMSATRATSSSIRTASATSSLGGIRSRSSRTGRRDRQPPRLGAGRWCVRRSAGRRLRTGGRSIGCGTDHVVPQRPIGMAVFVEEEGSRFGLPCLGSRLATGSLSVTHALSLRDAPVFHYRRRTSWQACRSTWRRSVTSDLPASDVDVRRAAYRAGSLAGGDGRGRRGRDGNLAARSVALETSMAAPITRERRA